MDYFVLCTGSLLQIQHIKQYISERHILSKHVACNYKYVYVTSLCCVLRLRLISPVTIQNLEVFNPCPQNLLTLLSWLVWSISVYGLWLVLRRVLVALDVFFKLRLFCSVWFAFVTLTRSSIFRYHRSFYGSISVHDIWDHVIINISFLAVA